MSQQLTTITSRLDDLPSEIIKTLANTGTPLSVAPDSSPSGSGSKVVVPPQLDRKDFPDVVHWTQVHYNALRKVPKSKGVSENSPNGNDPTPGTSTASSRNSNIKTSTISCFMEDKNGVPVSESEKDAARAKAKGFWIKLLLREQAPPTYCQASIDIQDEYVALMENNFPWLRYCENHWKAAQIWKNHYSDWHVKALRKIAEKAAKEKAAKGEAIDVDADNDNSQDNQSLPSKRPQVDGETTNPKRRRMEEDLPPTPPHPTPTKITTKRSRVRFIYIT